MPASSSGRASRSVWSDAGPAESCSTQASRVVSARAVCETALAATVRPSEWNAEVLRVDESGADEADDDSWTANESGKRVAVEAEAGAVDDEAEAGVWEGRAGDEPEAEGANEGIA